MMSEAQTVLPAAQIVFDNQDLVANWRSNISWAAVFETICMEGPIASASDIHKYMEPALGLSVEDVVDVLEGLKQLGLIDLTAKGYVGLTEKVVVPTGMDGKADAYIANRTHQIANLIESNCVSRYVNYQGLRLNEQLANEFVKEISPVIEKYMNLQNQFTPKADGAYECLLTLTRITRRTRGGGMT